MYSDTEWAWNALGHIAEMDVNVIPIPPKSN